MGKGRTHCGASECSSRLRAGLWLVYLVDVDCSVFMVSNRVADHGCMDRMVQIEQHYIFQSRTKVRGSKMIRGLNSMDMAPNTW
jgi:hypothetical protein